MKSNANINKKTTSIIVTIVGLVIILAMCYAKNKEFEQMICNHNGCDRFATNGSDYCEIHNYDKSTGIKLEQFNSNSEEVDIEESDDISEQVQEPVDVTEQKTSKKVEPRELTPEEIAINEGANDVWYAEKIDYPRYENDANYRIGVDSAIETEFEELVEEEYIDEEEYFDVGFDW